MAGTNPYGDPWVTCHKCGAVFQGYHQCVQPAVGGNVQPSWTFYSCMGAHHDFAVGPTHAVCNRCEKVVALEVKEGD